MIAAFLLAAASLPSAPVSPAEQSQLAAGLRVHIERIAEPLVIDGVSTIVHHVTGPGVPDLILRIAAKWRGQGSEAISIEQGTWHISSRLQGTTSEVLQWRDGTLGPELIWSWLDVRTPVLLPASRPFTLPAGCAWGRSTSGTPGSGAYRQISARCPQSVATLSTQLRSSLASQGWVVRSGSATALLIERPGASGLLHLSSPAGDSMSWLTFLQVENAR